MTLIRLFATTCCLILALGSSVRAETLADVLRDAYHNSGLLDQNRALLRAADEDVAQSMAALRPIIRWQAQAVYTDSTALPSASLQDSIDASVTLSMSLLLSDGGASQLATEAAKELVLQTRQGLVQAEQQVLFRAIDAYMSVRRTSEFLALRRSNVGVISQELRAAQDRFEVGEVTRTDVSLAEARLAAARSLLAAAQGGLAQANEEFRAAVGRAPGALAVVSPAAVQQDPEAARSYAMRYHPDVVAAQHAVTAAELNIRRAEAALNPRLSLDGALTVVEGAAESSNRLGVTYGGTIYQGGQLASIVRQSQARRDAARSALLITTQNANQAVGNAYAILGVAMASRQAADLQIRAARTAFRGVREEATLGARTTLDVLNAEQELLDAQASMISAQADEVVASYRVLATMGLLTAEHLNLGVQSYDPAAYYNLVREAPATYSEQGRALDRILKSIGD